MKGQKLFIRRMEPSDAASVESFLKQEPGFRAIPAFGRIGKLLGDLVAVLAMQITDDCVRIDDLVVAPHLRRKRIARAMLADVEAMAAKLGLTALVVEDGDDAADFLRRVGFDKEGDRWIRRVNSQVTRR